MELVRSLQPAPDANLAQLFRDDMLWAALTEVIAPFFHTDFEVVLRGLPGDDGRVYERLDGLRASWLDWLGPWKTYRASIEEAVDLGDQVLLLVRDFGRREGSTQEVTIDAAPVWTVREGKIARIDFYASREEALKAVGLTE